MNATNRSALPNGADPDADAFERLAELRRHAPPGFRQRVMAALPPRTLPERRWWPTGWTWLSPAVVGAFAMLLVTLGLSRIRQDRPALDTIVVQFEFHAPDAATVELVGDFTAWNPGRIQLEGPDESGHWTARVHLPAGRYEYLFLVDGRKWVTDPLAQTHRPDGFGNINAILTL